MLKLTKIDSIPEDQLKKAKDYIDKYRLPNIYGFTEIDSRVPPKECRKEGRLNDINDAFLYLAFDKATAIYEMRPSIGQNYSIAEFKTNKDVIIVDLSGEYSEDVKNDNMRLNSLVDKISEPNTENKTNFYHITQYMSHMLKEKKYDGIKYKSALNKGGTNLLLFDESNVDFICSDIVSINDVRVDYSQLLPYP